MFTIIWKKTILMNTFISGIAINAINAHHSLLAKNHFAKMASMSKFFEEMEANDSKPGSAGLALRGRRISSERPRTQSGRPRTAGTRTA